MRVMNQYEENHTGPFIKRVMVEVKGHQEWHINEVLESMPVMHTDGMGINYYGKTAVVLHMGTRVWEILNEEYVKSGYGVIEG